MCFIATSQQYDPTIDEILELSFYLLMTELISKGSGLALIYACMHFMQTHKAVHSGSTDHMHSTCVLANTLFLDGLELANALKLGNTLFQDALNGNKAVTDHMHSTRLLANAFVRDA